MPGPAPSTDPTEPTEAELNEVWERFFAAIRRAKGRAARRDGELSLSQFHLLACLAERPQARIGELAEEGGVAPPTATRMLEGLERDGIISREHAEEDRRAVIVRLTPKGRGLVEGKRAAVAEKRQALFGSLSAEERERAVALLDRLAEAIDEL